MALVYDFVRQNDLFTNEWLWFMTSCAGWTVLLTETENLFPDRRALDTEELQCGDELSGDGYLVLSGMELDFVLGLRII